MPTIKEAIEKGLDHLNPEAYFPLIKFANKNLHINMEKASRDTIVNWTKKYIFLNQDFSLAKKALSSLDNSIAYLQKAITKSNPTYAKRFFNFVKDKYAKSIVSQYFSKQDNKDKFIEQTTQLAKNEFVNKITQKLEAQHFTPSTELKNVLKNLVSEIEDSSRTLVNIYYLKREMAKLPVNAQKIVLDNILQKSKLNEDLLNTFNQAPDVNLIPYLQEKVNSVGAQLIKNKQAQEIYKYDGLVERIIPASIRGLNDVDRSVIEGIALKGDNSKVEDLFNFEVASGVRPNKTYNVGHTGASNRSSTTLANIAMYFASKHGLKHGKPQSTWVMIYESTKGINTTELVDEKVSWTEFEFATTQLKPGRFLGAVQFELDEANSDKNNIAFKAVDGFVNPKVHNNDYRKEGIEGDIKSFLDIAKHYDKPNQQSKPSLDFKLPKSSKKVSDTRTFFQKVYDLLGLGHNPIAYKKDRLNQLDFVQHETAAQKATRLAKEKSEMSYWQMFSDQLYNGASKIRPWLPSFNLLANKMEPKHKKVVTEAVREVIKSKP